MDIMDIISCPCCANCNRWPCLHWTWHQMLPKWPHQLWWMLTKKISTRIWFLDTLMVKVKSKQGNMCANVYTQGKFMKVIPMTLRKDARKSLIKFTNDVGIPDFLVTNGMMEFTSKNTKFMKEVWCMHIHLHTTKQGQKNQNHAAEHEIGMLAKHWKLWMTKKNVPKCLWDFGLVYEAEIMLRMVHRSDNHTGYKEVTGQMPNISMWLDFEFYDSLVARSPNETWCDQLYVMACLVAWSLPSCRFWLMLLAHYQHW